MKAGRVQAIELILVKSRGHFYLAMAGIKISDFFFSTALGPQINITLHYIILIYAGIYKLNFNLFHTSIKNQQNTLPMELPQ